MSRAAARSPGLLALDLALSSPESHYPRPRDRCPMSYRALAHGVIRSGLVCIRKTVRQRRRVVGNEIRDLTRRGPGRGALGRKSADFRLQHLRLLSPTAAYSQSALGMRPKAQQPAFAPRAAFPGAIRRKKLGRLRLAVKPG